MLFEVLPYLINKQLSKNEEVITDSVIAWSLLSI